MPFRNYGKSLPKYMQLASTRRSLLWEKARACSTSVDDSLPWRPVSGTWRRRSTSCVALENSVSGLLVASRSHSAEALGLAVSSFDEGRTLLTAISVISVIAATLAAWSWVGNGMVRRLSRMSERMRGMADGDLETPVPEVGRDEIGELATALEVFRQQAL